MGFLSRFFATRLPDVSEGDFSTLPETSQPPLFVYVRLPGHIEPLARGEHFEDPLDEQLAHAGAGAITGGGSLLSAPDADGTRTIQYCGIDVDLTRPRRGVVLLINELRRLHAPKGTTLEFTYGGQPIELDIYEQGN